MIISYLKLKNWRNFREAEIHLHPRSFLIGPNAAGKSNLLDALRFLRDICHSSGGGLKKAVETRGGIQKLRCLHARQDPEVSIEVHINDKPGEDKKPLWKYEIGFKPEGKGKQRLLVTKEKVWKSGAQILNRPDEFDKKDTELLTESHLENKRTNAGFREISEFFQKITYLHLVPQLLKHGEEIGGNRLEHDPFGQGFLERVSKCTEKTRAARLRKIGKSLTAAVPQFKELKFEKDDLTGKPHLVAHYEHHRPNAGWQREEHFSDGTLRLIGILWALLEGDSLLLLEEPELSLHQAVIEQIPELLARTQKEAKYKRQIIVSTHSENLLSNTGIDPTGVIILDPSQDGTKVRQVNKTEMAGLKSGLSISDVVLPQTRPKKITQMSFWE